MFLGTKLPQCGQLTIFLFNDCSPIVKYTTKKKGFCGRNRHLNLIEAIKDQLVSEKPYLEKKRKTAEKLSLLATSPLSLASESLPRPPSTVFTAAIPLHKVRLFN
jgi:hypothetical protein